MDNSGSAIDMTVDTMVVSGTGQSDLAERFPRVFRNPKLIQLRGLIQAAQGIHCPELGDYISKFLDTSALDLAQRFNPEDGLPRQFSAQLPEGFSHMRDFQGSPGVYFFISENGDNYIGSTNNL